jgi:hypothetical protein
MSIEPPTAKYTLTVKITGNSHEEIEREIHFFNNGGYLMDSDYNKRDEFHVCGGRITAQLEHTNPSMTPEQYDADLDAWWKQRRLDRSTSPLVGPEQDTNP